MGLCYTGAKNGQNTQDRAEFTCYESKQYHRFIHSVSKGSVLLSMARDTLCMHPAGVIIEYSMFYKNAREIIEFDYVLFKYRKYSTLIILYLIEIHLYSNKVTFCNEYNNDYCHYCNFLTRIRMFMCILYETY